MELTEDALLGGRLRIRQPVKGLRAGLDALLLAAAVPLTGTQPARLLDAGAGSGVVGIAVATAAPEIHVTAVEIDRELSALSMENAARNGMAGRFRAIAADLTQPMRELEALGLAAESFDLVVTNPPFQRNGEGRPSPEPRRQQADVMAAGGLERWARALAALTRPGGMLAMIHRADALADVLAALAGRFGALAVLPVHPRAGSAATRVLIQGVKGSRAPLALRPAFVLHALDGTYLPEADAILRGVQRLSLSDRPAKA